MGGGVLRQRFALEVFLPEGYGLEMFSSGFLTMSYDAVLTLSVNQSSFLKVSTSSLVTTKALVDVHVRQGNY